MNLRSFFVACLFLIPAFAAEPAPGLNLFSPNSETTTYLMDNDGNIVQTWESAYRAGLIAYLLDNGNILRAGKINDPYFDGGGAGGIVEEITPEGEVVWSFELTEFVGLLHHDIEVMPNGNILMIAWELISEEEALAAGRTRANLGAGEIWADTIIEVARNGSGGEIVWRWRVWDHLVQDVAERRPNFGNPADNPRRIDVNYLGSGRTDQADWNHSNGIDYNADLDQILVSVRNFSELWVIDHGTTTEEAATGSGGRYGHGGDLLYRWGNPAAYGRGTVDDQILFVQHDAKWIPEGYPGAGNILVFNNGDGRPDGDYSSVDEFTPAMRPDGSYITPITRAFGPRAPVWSYTGSPREAFYASFISGAQRLSNGNTLITDGPAGVFFEVDAEGNEVWRFAYGSNVFRVHRHEAL
ncbi:aryl-sulfate sulfotransferase [Acanthopleuribacter pedis]|uniref:Aryl-sulfate sulfotransferase n=1 Tax=Acanthopleuribacter pedis TaxID=442870 RepID=A0A8J7U2M0_9BACT|nr:aryl-sulfate sulfotransferase [Acanthopleuribacter pedis]MBO1317398.1 aryl-sulfate sulfotransferase [Acanthopleuribacter pedis]